MSTDATTAVGECGTVQLPAGNARESRLAALDRFFFREEVPWGMALTRITLPVVLLMNLGPRWMWAREIYSSDGAPSQLADNFGFPGFLPELPGTLAVALFTLLVFSLVMSAIGWWTRLSLATSVVLFSYFGLMDSMSTFTKFSVISIHLLFLLSLSHCGSLWSVDAWLAGRRGWGIGDATRFPVWPQRLIQLLVAIVYFGAAITKMHTPSFFSGDQLMYWMMTHVTGASLLGDYLSQYPVLLVVFGYVTLVWEVVFLFCVWNTRWRVPLLVTGILFHAMTTLTLGLVIFPLVMFSAYLSFLQERDLPFWSRLGARVQRWLPGRRGSAAGQGAAVVAGTAEPARPVSAWSSVGAYAVLTGLVMMAGVEIEYWRDPYQMRGPGGPLALKEIAPEEVDRLLASDDRIVLEDKFLAFDLGTTVVASHLLDHRTAYRQGEVACAQVSLNPPHEDMWVECSLHDQQMRLITRLGQIVSREALRGHFSFLMNDALAPGEYVFVVKSGGQEISRKSVTLLPRDRVAGSEARMSAN